MSRISVGRDGQVTVGPERQASLREYWNAVQKHHEAIQRELLVEVEKLPEFAALLKSMKPEQRAEQERRGQERQRQALADGDWAPYAADLRQQAETYARMGVSFASWMPLFTISREVIRRLLLAEAGDPARAAKALDGMGAFFDITVALLGEAYVATKEKLIGQQQQAIRELSTPILRLREGLLILPVVGLVDTQRARQLTESLLLAIRDQRARVAVMDITGVPVVDSKVANHLAQACEAARLMGAEVVLTGISPDIAQALVNIGAELRGVLTLADLQAGIEHASRVLEKQRQPERPRA